MEITGTKKLFRFNAASKPSYPTDLTPTLAARVTSIDLLRGLVMIIMALDHVRDYFHADAFLFDPTDLSKTNVPLFFTRFITHYCAPVFMLLSGTSAYLVGIRKGKKALTKFLFTRGLWLIFLELTIINFGWFFDFGYANTGTLVIWALGMSMIFLSALIHLPKAAILVLRFIMIFGHNLLDTFHVEGNGAGSVVWALLHEPKIYQVGNITFFALYPLIPWIGVMSLGYCLGTWYENGFDAIRRKKLLWQLGLTATFLFIALRFTNWYGDQIQWSNQSSGSFTVLSFFSLSKYPPSLLYLLITVGPAMILLAFTENSNGWFGKRIQVIGRVPMFYYLVHIYLIHLAAMVAAELSGYNWSDMVLTTWVSFEPKLKDFGFSLATTYLVWGSLVVILYFMCKWYDHYKRTHKNWWLSYM
jgi:uncharacterized membrane protein